MKKRKNSIYIGDKIRCHKCKEVKNKSEFHKNSSRSNGLAGQCKQCEYKPKNKLGKYSGNRIFLRQFYAYRNGCPRRNLSFNITLNEFVELTHNNVCYYCGQKSHNKDYVGVDRVDSAIDYDLNNCVPCCDICNRMKSNYDQDFFLTHITKIYNHTN